MRRHCASLVALAAIPAMVGSFSVFQPPCPYHSNRGAISRHRRTRSIAANNGRLPTRRERRRPSRISVAAASESSTPRDTEQRTPQPSPEYTAESVLRRLSPSELEGMKGRLGLDDSLEGEETIAQAVPLIAAKIRAREAAQEGQSAAVAAEQRPPADMKELQLKISRQITSQSSEANWAGEDGVERGWVGDKGNRRWVGAPGEKPPRQRHAKREPDPPLAPGQRSYFATCPRYDPKSCLYTVFLHCTFQVCPRHILYSRIIQCSLGRRTDFVNRADMRQPDTHV